MHLLIFWSSLSWLRSLPLISPISPPQKNCSSQMPLGCQFNCHCHWHRNNRH